MLLEFRLNRFDRHEHRRESQVDHDSDPEVHHRHVELIRSTRSVTQRQNEASHQRNEIEPFENHSQDLTGIPKERLVSEVCRKNVEDQEEVTLIWLAKRS